MSNARAIVRVLIEHTRQLVTNEPSSTKAKGSLVLSAPSVLDRAATLFGHETFKVAELADRLGRAGRGRTEQLKKQLDTLVRQGAVERLPRRATGGRSEGPFYSVRLKKAQVLAMAGQIPCSDDKSGANAPEGVVEATSAVPRGLYLTDRSDGAGRWLDLSDLAEDQKISVADLRTKLAAAEDGE